MNLRLLPLSLLLLTACAGGRTDDDEFEPTGTLNVSTALLAAQVGLRAANGVMALTDHAGAPVPLPATVTGDGDERTFDLAAFCRRRLGELVAGQSVRPSTLVATSPNGGTLTTTIDDVAPLNQLSVGDAIELVFVDYQELGDVIDGMLRIEVLVAEGDSEFDPTWRLDVRMTFASLTSVFAGWGDFLDGSVVFGSSQQTTSRSETLLIEQGLAREQNTFLPGTELRYFENEFTGEFVQRSSGALMTDFLGSFRFYTYPEFVGVGTRDDYPSTGELVLEGADGSLRIIAVSDTMARIELDANGDGLFETRVDAAWQDLY